MGTSQTGVRKLASKAVMQVLYAKHSMCVSQKLYNKQNHEDDCAGTKMAKY